MDVARAKRNLKKVESKKSHSWWWDSHITPKNSKWLADNLEEMDRSVKRMLKLIEEDADSFAKKAEMYYQKRPELIRLVEEFYRMYRSLAERYDFVSGELKKSPASDIQSQSSGISDISTEVPLVLPSSEQRLTRRKSGPRAAGFEFFLGYAGGSPDVNQKEGDESSSLTDSEMESDDSSVNNYSDLIENGDQQMLSRKIIDLEIELREAKEKLQMLQEGNMYDSSKRVDIENLFDPYDKIATYEQELKEMNEKLQISEEEITRLKFDLQSYQSFDRESQVGETEDLKGKIQPFAEELQRARTRLQDADKEITSLKQELKEASKSSDQKLSNLWNQLELAQNDAATWKGKANAEKREVSKLQERVLMLKSSLYDRDREIRDLKTAVSDAEEKIFPEKARIKAEISKLQEEQTRMEEYIKELESRGRFLEDDIRIITNERKEMEQKFNNEIDELKSEVSEKESRIKKLCESINALGKERDRLQAELSSAEERFDKSDKHLKQLKTEHMGLIARAEEAQKLVDELEAEVQRQRRVISEGEEEKREAIRQLCFSLEHYRSGYVSLRRAVAGAGHQIKRVPVLAS